MTIRTPIPLHPVVWQRFLLNDNPKRVAPGVLEAADGQRYRTDPDAPRPVDFPLPRESLRLWVIEP